jgi:hypothetical protein
MDDITRLSLSALYDLLSSKTITLLDEMSRKSGPSIVDPLKVEVQQIQSELRHRKSLNLKGNFVLKFSKN